MRRRLSIPVVPAIAAAALLALPLGCAPASNEPRQDAGPTPGLPDAVLADLAKGELTRRVTQLASDALEGRDEGTLGGQTARDYLIRELEACGLEPAGVDGYEQPITTGAGVNVLARVPGTDPSLDDRPVVVSAHYDHLGGCGGEICNGAYDNAAGVSAVVALGCALKAAPAPRPVLVALWDAEEPPTFLTEQMGSAFYAANPTVPLDDIAAVIVLDLVGAELWPGWAGHVVLGAELSPEVAMAVDAAELPEGLEALRGGLHLVEETPFGHQPWSDYDAFRDRGVPVLFLSDGQNKRYHTPDDEVEALSLDKLALETRFLWSVVTNLASTEGELRFEAQGRDYARDAATLTRVLEAAIAEGGLLDGLGLSEAAREKLEEDLVAVREVASSLEGGGMASPTQVGALRTATQRVMCLAGPSYSELVCNSL